MARSDAILQRLLALHPRIIDLSLDRMQRLLAKLGHPEQRLPPVIHVAGTNGKGSTTAYLKAICEAAKLSVHVYTSPHLVKFHERISLNGELIAEDRLSALLEECEAVNGSDPITFFEITTAAAFLAFSRMPADYVILEVGLGGRLDATNVAEGVRLSVITVIDYDHQQYLGDTLTAIAHEKAGILRRGVSAVIGPQPDEAMEEIERVAAHVRAPIFTAGQYWSAFEQHGRLVVQDEEGLLDLPLPALRGSHQIDNAGIAVEAIRRLKDPRLDEKSIALGLKQARWPARLQRLGPGALSEKLPPDAELWVDGGHNPSAGRVVARAFAGMNERHERSLVLIWGMLGTKDAARFIRAFAGEVQLVITIAIPGEENGLSAAALMEIAKSQGLPAEASSDLGEALARAAITTPSPRVLICGSLYLAGHVLAVHDGEKPSAVTGRSRG